MSPSHTTRSFARLTVTLQALIADGGVAQHRSMSRTAAVSSWTDVRLCVSSPLQACCRADATLQSRLTSGLQRATELGAAIDAEFDKLSTTHLVVPSPLLLSAATVATSAAAIATADEKHPAINCRWCSVVYVEWLERSLDQCGPLNTTDASLVLHDASDYVRRRSHSLKRYRDRRLLDVQAWLEKQPHELLPALSPDLLDQLEAGDTVTVVFLPGPTQRRMDESTAQQRLGQSSEAVDAAADSGDEGASAATEADVVDGQQDTSVKDDAADVDDATLVDAQRAELAFLRLTARLPAMAHSADSASDDGQGARWSALQLSDNTRVRGASMRSVVQLEARRHVLHVTPLLELQDLSDCDEGEEDGYERVDPARTQSLLPGRRVQVVGLQATLRGVHRCELLTVQVVSVHPGRTRRPRQINTIRGEWLQDDEDVRYTGELLQWPVEIAHVAPGDSVMFGPQHISRLSREKRTRETTTTTTTA